MLNFTPRPRDGERKLCIYVGGEASGLREELVQGSEAGMPHMWWIQVSGVAG